MYSTKNIENILIAELSRKQERKFMEDVSRDAEISYKEIWQVRKKEVYQRIFGNKYRIWIPLDIGVDITNQNLNEYNTLYDKYNSFILLNYCADNIYRNFLVIAEYFSEIPKDLKNVSFAELVLYWIKGYIKIGKNIIKIGTLIKKLQVITKKSLNDPYIPDEDKEMFNKFIKKLNSSLDAFNKRDRDERLPKELYLAGRNVPDEEIYGTSIKKDKLWICISRHPVDIGAMSTRQGWASCQNLDKLDKNSIEYDHLNWHVKYDVALGTCVAYLITESNIKRSKERQNVPTEYDDKFKGKTHIPKTSLFPLLSPTARVLIKPYFSEDGQVYLTIGTRPVVYGDNTYSDIFTNTVNAYFEEKQANISGTFTIPRELYNEALKGNKNTVKVKNGKITSTTGSNNMYRNEREVPKRSLIKVLDKLRNIASSMEKTDEGIEINHKLYDNEYHLIIANKSNYNNENIKSNSITIINSNLYNCNIEATSNLLFGYGHLGKSQLLTELESGITEEEKLQILKYKPNVDIQQIIHTWARKESTFENCIFRCYDLITMSGELSFNNCIFEKVTGGIAVDLEDFSKIKNTTFNNTRFINILQNKVVSSAKEITGNTYNNTTINIVLNATKSKHILYFVGDSFNNITFDFNYAKNIAYFVDCSFNGELLKGTYKIKFDNNVVLKQLRNVTAKTIQENAI